MVQSERKTEMVKWLTHHGACREGKNWAEEHCESLDEVWAKIEPPTWRIWVATRPGVLDGRTLSQFAVYVAREVWDHLSPSGQYAIKVVERHLKGEATDNEVAEAYWDIVAGDLVALSVLRIYWDSDYAPNVNSLVWDASLLVADRRGIFQRCAIWLQRNVDKKHWEGSHPSLQIISHAGRDVPPAVETCNKEVDPCHDDSSRR